MNNADIDKIVRSAINGYPYNARILEPVIKYFYPKLKKLTKLYLYDDSDVEDVVQNTLIRMYEYLPKFQFRSSFRAWIYKIALNEAKTYLDNLYKNDRIKNELSNSLAEHKEGLNYKKNKNGFSNNIVQKLRIIQILDKMNEINSEALKLFYFEDLTIREISIIIDISESAVKMRLSRAKQEFARYWNER